MKIFAFGSSIVSSYWNGAATYYRGVYTYLARRGHTITFAEPDAYGRQQHRDAGDFSYVESIVYPPTVGLEQTLARAREADILIKHSGIGVDDAALEQQIAALSTKLPTFFWDVDSPATLGRIERDHADPFHNDIPRFDGILSYGGGPRSHDGYLAHGARAYFSIYNGLDPETHHPEPADPAYASDVTFLGNRLPDREARVEELFFAAAEGAPGKQFLLGGEGWEGKQMPPNVRWIGHVPTSLHNRVNCSAGMVLNINRASMASFGFSPPTRVFEAAGAGVCMLCDDWPGIEDCFEPETEILVIRTAEDVVQALLRHDAHARKQIGAAFHHRALRDHTYAQRAAQADAAFHQCIAARNQS